MDIADRQAGLYRCAVRFSDGKSIVAIRNGFAVASAKFPCFKLNTKLQAAVAVLFGFVLESTGETNAVSQIKCRTTEACVAQINHNGAIQ